jgi:hypothetical protein
MMKNLDPAQLAEMMRSSGLNVTPEQARSMVDQLDRVSGEGEWGGGVGWVGGGGCWGLCVFAGSGAGWRSCGWALQVM